MFTTHHQPGTPAFALFVVCTTSLVRTLPSVSTYSLVSYSVGTRRLPNVTGCLAYGGTTVDVRLSTCVVGRDDGSLSTLTDCWYHGTYAMPDEHTVVHHATTPFVRTMERHITRPSSHLVCLTAAIRYSVGSQLVLCWTPRPCSQLDLRTRDVVASTHTHTHRGDTRFTTRSARRPAASPSRAAPPRT